MGSIDVSFATDLRDGLKLRRAVETGTFRGITARKLSRLFDEVVTIELSPELHRAASGGALRDLSNVRALQGHSGERLREIVDATVPTLFFLDGHWSGGPTSGADHECPILEEITAIGAGHPDDTIIVDDARLFASSPPPPHRPEQWPSLLEIIDAIRVVRPEHIITVVDDQIIAAPARARPAIDVYGQQVQKASFFKDGASRVSGRLRTGFAR